MCFQRHLSYRLPDGTRPANVGRSQIPFKRPVMQTRYSRPGYAGAFRALALHLNERVPGPEAGRSRSTSQAARNQFRGCLLDRATLTANHKDDRLPFFMAMIAGEKRRAGGQSVHAACLLQEIEGAVDLNGLHLPRTAESFGDLVRGHWSP